MKELEYQLMKEAVLKKYPNAKVTMIGGKFAITSNGINVVSPDYGNLMLNDSIKNAWKSAYITNYIWNKNISRNVKGISKPKEIEITDFEYNTIY
jgi:hypothetical protein